MLRWQRLVPYLYLLPSGLFLALFVLWPALQSFALSFQRWDFLAAERPFVGGANYAALLQSAEFWNSVRVSLGLVALSVPVRLVLALALALLLLRETRANRLVRAVLMLPGVSSAVTVAVVFSWIFNTDLGFVNLLLGRLGLGRPDWLGSLELPLVVLAVVVVWKQLGYDVLVYIVALQAIPQAYLEAARVDGASRWQSFRHVSLPLLTPTTFFLLVMGVLDAFHTFTLVNVMTGGGPALATDVLVNLLYRTSFVFFDIGKASALAVLLFGLLGTLTALQFYWIGRRVHYENS
ncbi:carbohydrate ABC transporter permease [Calidithermus chliarophilus]|uniref:carbohydrate ABC transporter permease n=1 Tax=Calidithermus chliarophilus TaxID=52023 RepID=UPI0003FC0ED3|nr:sugar ABC transporter permease [Calidithermus chliarophilus]